MARAYDNDTPVDMGGHTFDSDDGLMGELLRTIGGTSYSAQIFYRYPDRGWRFEDIL